MKQILIYLYAYTSLLFHVCAVFVFVYVCDIKEECYQKPCLLCQPYIKYDSLSHKTHFKVPLVLRYQASTSVEPSNH